MSSIFGLGPAPGSGGRLEARPARADSTTVRPVGRHTDGVRVLVIGHRTTHPTGPIQTARARGSEAARSRRIRLYRIAVGRAAPGGTGT